MADDKLIKAKRDAKARKPKFTRTDSHKKDRVESGTWRRPKGLQSKMRLHKKGYHRTVDTGYGTPKELRGTTRDGLAIKRVENKNDLEQLDPKADAALIGNVGRKKKEELIKAAQEKGLALANLAVKAYQEKTAKLEELKKRKKETLKRKAEAKRKAEKAKKEEEAKQEEAPAEKEAEEKPSEDEASQQDQSAPDEEKKKEKEEKDKVLTSKKGY